MKISRFIFAVPLICLSIAAQAQAATLAGVSVTGPNSANENSVVNLAANAVYSTTPVTTANVTTSTATVWKVYQKNASGALVSTALATISKGTLTIKEITANTSLYVTAAYTEGSVTKTSAAKSIAVANIVVTPPPPPVSGSHAGRITSAYTGSKVCQPCHLQQTKDSWSSLHYQWENYSTGKVANRKTGVALGKRYGINGFCGYVGEINWLSKLTNGNGQQVDGGCARCHAGMGEKPSPVASQAQYDNVNCLICHSDTYKQTIVKNAAGAFVFAPMTSAGNGSIAMASNIVRSSNNLCLNCHIKAGGGNNFKRGTLGETMRNPTRDQEVHLSQAGAKLLCTSCHTSKNHKIAGVGADLPSADSSVKVNCSTSACHVTASLHAANTRMNDHAKRIACQTCHIPFVAATDATDMNRRYDMPAEYNSTTALYDPWMDKQMNIKPVYRFFDGKVNLYQFGDPITTDANGIFTMVAPTATIASAGAKITPFRLHQTTVTKDASNRMLPMKMGLLFSAGDISSAVLNGVSGVGWTYSGYTYQLAQQFMAVDHGVVPKAQALTCNDCHYGATRIDFKALGYTLNAAYNGKPLCASCHSDKSNTWAVGKERFDNVHSRHVTSQRLNCNVCHPFSKAL
ncbi:hypothetical protein HGA34_00030 [Candidatus Falkowbacteria bacterium]|nr:hypothetical protein [Candidatus Falkowbacteria bacterium]